MLVSNAPLPLFFFKQKTAYEMLRSLVGSEMCIRDREDIELVSPSTHFVQHGEMCADVRLEGGRIEPDRALAHRDEPRCGSRLATREQCDVVAKRHESVGQVRNHAFGSTVKRRGYRFGQRRNLGDLQRISLYRQHMSVMRTRQVVATPQLTGYPRAALPVHSDFVVSIRLPWRGAEERVIPRIIIVVPSTPPSGRFTPTVDSAALRRAHKAS